MSIWSGWNETELRGAMVCREILQQGDFDLTFHPAMKQPLSTHINLRQTGQSASGEGTIKAEVCLQTVAL